MAFTERLAILITGDAAGAIREFDKVGKSAEQNLGKTENRIDRVGSRMQVAGASAIAFAAVGASALHKFADAGSDLAESQSKVGVVFGESAGDIKSWAKTAATSLGQSEQQALEAAGTFGNLFRAMQIGTPTAAEMSKKIVGLATDLASFNNADPTEVLEALRAGLVGEAEPLRKFGINLSAARIETEALKLGLAANKDELTAGAKAQAAYKLILDDTTLAQGDFARTSDGAANQQRILSAQFKDLQANIGQGVLPVFTTLLKTTNGVLGKFNDLDPATQKLVGSIGTIAVGTSGAVGALSFLAGTVAKLRTRFLSNPAEGLSGGLNVFGKAAAGAAVAGGVLAVAYYAMTIRANEARKRVDDLTDAVKNQKITLGAAAGNELADWIGKHSKAKDVASDLELSVKDLNSAIQGSKKDYDAVAGPLKEYVDAQSRSGKANEDATIAAKNLLGHIDEQRKAFRTAKEEIKSTNTATDELKDTNLDTTKATAGLGDAQQDLAGDTSQTTEELEKQAKAAKEADDAFRDYNNTLFDARDAQRAVDDSTFALTESLAEYKKKSDDASGSAFKNAEKNREWQKSANDVKASIDNVAKSAGDLAGKNARLFGVTQTARIEHDAQRDALIRLRDTISPKSPFRGYLDGLIADLERLDRTDPNVNITVSAHGTAAVNILNAKLGGRAKGGPVHAGEPYVVGEDGPELFVPKQSGQIVPNGRTSSFRGVSSGGNTAVFNVAIYNPSGNGDQLADQLVKSLKSGRNAAEFRRVMAGV